MLGDKAAATVGALLGAFGIINGTCAYSAGLGLVGCVEGVEAVE